MNSYQFSNISRVLQREHGKLTNEERDGYAMLFFSLESNALKVHREYPSANDVRMQEAINLTLHTINGYITGQVPDLSRFENDDNLRLKHALLMAIDPFTNEEIKAVLLSHGDESRLEDREFLNRFFHPSIMCLMQIQESIQFHSSGSNGYFRFLEGFFGDKVEHDMEMHFVVPAVNR